MLQAIRQANQHEDIVNTYHALQTARKQHGEGGHGLDASGTHEVIQALCQDKTNMLIELIDAVGPFLEHHHGHLGVNREPEAVTSQKRGALRVNSQDVCL